MLRSACRCGGHFTQLAAQFVVGRASVQAWFLTPGASLCLALCARQTPDWTAIGSVGAVGERQIRIGGRLHLVGGTDCLTTVCASLLRGVLAAATAPYYSSAGPLLVDCLQGCRI